MKKLLLITLSLSLLLMTAACGSNQAETEPSTPDTSVSDEMPSTNEDMSTEPSTDEEEDASAEEEAESETEEEAQPEAKPEAKPETKPAAKPEAKPAAKPESKPAAKPETKPESKPAEKPAAGYTGDVNSLVASMYQQNPVEFMVGDPMPLDLSDKDLLSYNTGLTDSSKMKEAYVSEAMIGSIAYSMVIVRANSPADAAAVAKDIYSNINQSKWICVTANAIAAGASGDLAMVVMVDSELAPDLHTKMLNSFKSLSGGSLSYSDSRVDALA